MTVVIRVLGRGGYPLAELTGQKELGWHRVGETLDAIRDEHDEHEESVHHMEATG